MKLVFFGHSLFLGSQSMPRFINMLAEGMKLRGHEVDVWIPEAKLSNLPAGGFKKWLSYVDQYILFPQQVKRKIKKNLADDVLYVFTDHALGPYVPLVKDKSHVIHCHDFLAQRSALGEIPENITSWTGEKYQSFIRNGYIQGKNFISVSEKTRKDLERLLDNQPQRSEMVYNGVNPEFEPKDVKASRSILGTKIKRDLASGYILHVGGNQWYKNRVGVISIYNKLRENFKQDIPLIMIGKKPSDVMINESNASSFADDIYFITDADDSLVRSAYAGASVFLFPSLAEGFGWPIAEAMASGTLVITTNENPMLEVAGDAAFLIYRKPEGAEIEHKWAVDTAEVVNRVLTLSDAEQLEWKNRGLDNISRFKLERALDQIEGIYLEILNDNKNQGG